MTLAIDYKASPNHSSRNGTKISMIVLHATVGSYQSSLDWLRNPQPKTPSKRVSTHYLIDRDGSITQLVADDEAAWHAGSSAWRGMNSANIKECSLSIELVNLNTGTDPYPAAQLASCRDLCRDKIVRYAIPRLNIVRHLDIATPVKRKTDPAGLDFARFVESVFSPAVIVPTMPKPVPLPTPKRYRVREIQISQRQIGGEPYAGTLQPGDYIEIDIVYANNMCHLANGAGFVPIAALEPAAKES